MKNRVKIILVVFLFFCASSCMKRKQVDDGFLRGIYETSNQSYEAKTAEDTMLDEKAPTYDQYKEEREEILNDSEVSGPQQ